MLFQLISIVGSSTALLSLALSLHPENTPYSAAEITTVIIAVVLSIAAASLEIRRYITSRPKRTFKTRRQIRDYMLQWVDHGARVCIFSNDLSWVDDEDMIAMLRKKAARDELQVCVPSPTDITEDLKSHGATILTYEHLKVTPLSRFTIVNHGKMDSQIAIGRRVDGLHAIEEFGAGDHPVFAVAKDLIEIVIRYNQTRRPR
jgi:hypothetical protein